MADRFAEWDRFERHRALTGDPRKALRWAAYESWTERRRLKALQEDVEMALEEREALTLGAVSGNTTKR